MADPQGWKPVAPERTRPEPPPVAPPSPQGPVAGLRSLYPELEDLDDEKLIKGVHKVDFGDLTEEQFLVGLAKTYGPAPVPPKGRGVLSQLGRMVSPGIPEALAGLKTPEAEAVRGAAGALGGGVLNTLREGSEAVGKLMYLPTAALPAGARKSLKKATGIETGPAQAVEALPRAAAEVGSLFAGYKAEQALGRGLAEAGAAAWQRAAAAGATYGGTYEGILGTLKGEDPQQLVSNVAQGVVAGSLIGAGLHAGGEAAGRQLRYWLGTPAAPLEASVAERLGTKPVPEPVEPHPVELPPAGPPRTVTEPPAGQYPGLGPEPNTIEGRVPGLQGAAPMPPPEGPAARLAPEGRMVEAPRAPQQPLEVVGPLEQPRPAAGAAVLEPTAVPPGPPVAPLGVTAEGPLPAAPPQSVPGLQSPIEQVLPERPPTPPAAAPLEPSAAFGGARTVQPADPAAFVAAVQAVKDVPTRTGNTVGSMLTPYTAEDLAGKGAKTYLAPDGKTGFALIPREDGGLELASLFNAGRPGAGAIAAQDAVDMGATHLDVFDPYLPDFYKLFGFKEYRREPNWTPGGPDVVYMQRPSSNLRGATDAPLPGPGHWREFTELADRNIVAAKARILERQQARVASGEIKGVQTDFYNLFAGEGGYIDPANIRDAAIIGANYILRGATKFADFSTMMLQDFGEAVQPHLNRLYQSALAMHNSRGTVGNDYSRVIASHYMDELGGGLPPVARDFLEFRNSWGRDIASLYNKLPEKDPSAKKHYDALKNEVKRQFKKAQDSGINFVFEGTGDPYRGSVESLNRDLRENNTIRLPKTPDDYSHPFMSPEDNDMLRAVHDLFGHSASGYGFDTRGAYNAWLAHSELFSNMAIPALATETLGQTASVRFGKILSKEASEARPFTLAKPKGAILPEKEFSGIIEARGKGKVYDSLSAGAPTTSTERVSTTHVARRLTKGVPKAADLVEARSRAESDILENVKKYMDANPKAAVWYHDDIAAFEKNVQKEFPHLLGNPGGLGVYKMVTAITSPTRKPILNVDTASRVWDHYSRTGKVPIIARLGQELGRNVRPSLTKVSKLVQEHGGEQQLVDYLLTKNEKGVYNAVSEFGPKVGRFWLNLMGIHDEVTVDVWMTRWWHRLMGTPFDKNGVLIDAPVNDEEGEVIRATIIDMANQLGIDPDALQAVLWDREKRLWREAGARDSGDLAFAAASEIVFKNRAESHAKAPGRFIPPPEQGALALGAAAPEPMIAPADLLKKSLAKKPPAGKALWEQVVALYSKRPLGKGELAVVKPADGSFLEPAYVVPDGRVMRLGTDTHHELAEGAYKKLKVKYEGDASVAFQREGMIRVNPGMDNFAVSIGKAPTPEQVQTIARQYKMHQEHGNEAGITAEIYTESGGLWPSNIIEAKTFGEFQRGIEDTYKWNDTVQKMVTTVKHMVTSPKDVGLSKGRTMLWLAPNGTLIAAKDGRHSMVADQMLRGAGVTAPPTIGANNGSNQTLLNLGFIRVQARGELNAELTYRPTNEQTSIILEILPNTTFGVGNAVSPRGTFSSIIADTWPKFQRMCVELPYRFQRAGEGRALPKGYGPEEPAATRGTQ